MHHSSAAVSRRRKAAAYLALAEQARDAGGGDAWMDRLDRELPAIRAVLDALAASDDPRDVETALRLAGALRNFWFARGHLDEGWERFTALLARRVAVRSAARARALDDAGALAFWRGDAAAARALAEESLALERQLGNKPRMAVLLMHLGQIAWLADGDAVAARPRFEEALVLAQEVDDRWGVGAAHHLLGAIALDQGDAAGARAHFGESLAVYRALGRERETAFTLVAMARAACAHGDLAAARAALTEAIGVGQRLADAHAAIEALEASAELAAAEQRPRRALRLAAAAAALRRARRAPSMASLEARHQQRLETARRLLGEEEQTAATRHGESMTLEEAAAYALSGQEI